MVEDKKSLGIVSNEAKKSIALMPIVTPSIYSAVFSKFATEHNIDLSNEIGISKNLLDTEYKNLTLIQDSTIQNVHHLSETTSKAVHALKNRDEDGLKEVASEVEKLKAEVEKLKEAVYKDELTNTYNRKWLHDHYLNDDGVHFKNSGVLAMIDLNYFKLINDTHGHIVGDKVLIFIANQLKTRLCTVVRYGGDEFILMIHHNVTIGDAQKALNDIREKVISTTLKANHATFHTSFSIGIVPYKSGDELSDVISNADEKMYTDKLEIKKHIKGIS